MSRCDSCGVDFQDYRVGDSQWYAVTRKTGIRLCLGCFDRAARGEQVEYKHTLTFDGNFEQWQKRRLPKELEREAEMERFRQKKTNDRKGDRRK